MMQLVYNGEVLDLYENADIQFKHENPLFAFDKLSCERTTNFKLPATPKNDKIFGLARIPAYKGDGMRRKFTAQLQAGLVTKDGYLYISDYDGKDYKAIFVTGELVGLQRIKEFGKLEELDPIDHYPWVFRSNMSPEYASDATFKTSIFGYFHYLSEGRMYPSINLGMLMQYVARQNNIQITIPEKAFEMRIALPDLKTPEDTEGHVISTRDAEEDDYVNVVNTDAFLLYLTEPRGFEAKKTILYRRGHSSVTGEVLRTEETAVMVEHFRCPNDIEITFPDDFPEEYFLVRMNPLVSGYCVFLGDYSFTTSQQTAGDGGFTRTGEPLTGRTVAIPADESFILIKYAREHSTRDGDYKRYTENTYIQIDDEPVAVTACVNGWDFEAADALAYNIQVKISVTGENVSEWRMIDNLPDITFTDLIKAVAFELGLVLNYSEIDGLTFDEIKLDNFGKRELNALTKRGEVKRVFSDYAQHNYVQFADDDVFLNASLSRKDYVIDNDNIAVEDTLAVLPWTCGLQQGQYVRDKLGRSKFLEIRYNTNLNGLDAFFARIAKNADIQRLCDASTQIKVSSRMGLFDYNLIKPKSSLLVEGSRYVWTERSWQKNVANFTLARFAQEITPPEPLLPPEYQQVEWIAPYEDTTPQILLPYVINSPTQIELRVFIPIGWRWYNYTIFGRRYYSYSCNFATEGIPQIGFNFTSHYYTRSYYAYLPFSQFAGDDWVIMYADMATGYTSIETTGIKKEAFDAPMGSFPKNNLVIFDSDYYEAFRIAKIKATGVFELFPCYRKSDNVAGMYDTVTRQFFTNTGSGSFIVGPDVN